MELLGCLLVWSVRVVRGESAGYASSGTLNLRSVLARVVTRKGATFHFGSTHEANSQNEAWMETLTRECCRGELVQVGCHRAQPRHEQPHPLQGCPILWRCARRDVPWPQHVLARPDAWVAARQRQRQRPRHQCHPSARPAGGPGHGVSPTAYSLHVDVSDKDGSMRLGLEVERPICTPEPKAISVRRLIPAYIQNRTTSHHTDRLSVMPPYE
jgi:hypothetical protein